MNRLAPDLLVLSLVLACQAMMEIPRMATWLRFFGDGLLPLITAQMNTNDHKWDSGFWLQRRRVGCALIERGVATKND